jgi:hypothetical protein
LNTIYKKNQFQGKADENPLDFGTSPLSRVGGTLIRDLAPKDRKTKLELYRPPGIIRKVPYIKGLTGESQLGENIWNSVPSNKIYVRDPFKKAEQDEQAKYTKSVTNVESSK